MKYSRDALPLGFFILLALIASLASVSCNIGGGSDEDKSGDDAGDGTPNTPVVSVAGHEQAKESVLRAIPSTYINAARTGLHVAYQHTSHGTHVAYGLYGLQAYKSGDETLFGVSTSGEPGKLDFQENGIQEYWPATSGQHTYCDLSTSDNEGWSVWLVHNREFLDDPANAEINVVMWSWCDISNHHVSEEYLPSMQTLIDEYGPGGSKIGSGAGQRETPVTFVFMTGHAGANYSGNVGDRLPKNQADLINAYCAARGYYCLDYYSIDSHDMDGNYYEDATDDAASATYGGNYNQAWQTTHIEGTDWFYNQGSPGGTATDAYGEHLSQHITSNRKAYAMWYILARIAGWNGQ